MVGRLTEPMRESFASLSLALLRGNSEGVVNAIVSMGSVPPDLDRPMFIRDIEDLRDRYYEVSLRELNLSQVVQDIFGVAYRHRIRIPLDFTLLAKCLVTMEGVVDVLDPGLSILEIARPFGATLVKERLSPQRVARRLERQGETLAHALLDLPVDASRVARQAAEGRLTLQVESANPRMERAGRRMTRALILALGGTVSALVGAAYLIASALRPGAYPLPVLPVLAFLFAILLFWQALRQT
jgi:ubiquinone biosynthesis protein